MAQLDEQGTCIYRIEVGPNSPALGQTVMQMKLPAGCVLIAIQRSDDIHVPGPGDLLKVGDTLVAIAHEGLIKKLQNLFS